MVPLLQSRWDGNATAKCGCNQIEPYITHSATNTPAPYFPCLATAHANTNPFTVKDWEWILTVVKTKVSILDSSDQNVSSLCFCPSYWSLVVVVSLQKFNCEHLIQVSSEKVDVEMCLVLELWEVLMRALM